MKSCTKLLKPSKAGSLSSNRNTFRVLSTFHGLEKTIVQGVVDTSKYIDLLHLRPSPNITQKTRTHIHDETRLMAETQQQCARMFNKTQYDLKRHIAELYKLCQTRRRDHIAQFDSLPLEIPTSLVDIYLNHQHSITLKIINHFKVQNNIPNRK